MPLKSRLLLDQLSELQSALEGFSFDHLNSEEALQIKQSFEVFRSKLEGRIFHPHTLREERPVPQLARPRPSDQQSPEELIALVSHEIRTPLSGITGFADLLMESELDAEQTRYLSSIRSAASSLLEMANALMDYSRACVNPGLPVSVPFAPEQVLREVCYLCQTLILESDLEFSCDISPELPGILQGDPSRLSQILMNLLGNAIKFTRSGRIALRVSSYRSGPNCMLHCQISDTGPGIPESELGRVFEPYAKVSNRPQISGEGLGLGLSLVKQWVDQIGGSVAVCSTVGEGTTFTLELPFAVAVANPGENLAAKPGEEVAQLKGKSILVFEDNPLNMRLVESRLSRWGCNVHQALRSSDGLEVLDKTQVHLVLMDLRMPGMDGFEVSRRIRNHKSARVRSLPIVALTADFSESVENQIRTSGINDLVLKPFTPHEFLQVLLKHLGRNEGQEGGRSRNPKRQDTTRLLCLDRLWSDCNRDMEMLEETIRLFRNGVLEFLGALHLHSKGPDYEEIRAAAHKVKAGLKLLQVKPWLDRLEAIQELARNEKGAGVIRGQCEALKADFPELEKALEEALMAVKRKSKDGG